MHTHTDTYDHITDSPFSRNSTKRRSSKGALMFHARQVQHGMKKSSGTSEEGIAWCALTHEVYLASWSFVISWAWTWHHWRCCATQGNAYVEVHERVPVSVFCLCYLATANCRGIQSMPRISYRWLLCNQGKRLTPALVCIPPSAYTFPQGCTISVLTSCATQLFEGMAAMSDAGYFSTINPTYA